MNSLDLWANTNQTYSKRVAKLRQLTDLATYWNDVKKLTKGIYSDSAIKSWQRLAELRERELINEQIAPKF